MRKQDPLLPQYLHRIDRTTSSGWQIYVTQSLGSKGKFTKFFADRKHGGKNAAKEAAELFLKNHPTLLPNFPQRPTPRPRVRPVQSSSSEFRGVHYHPGAQPNSGAWFAELRGTDGKRTARSFSCRKYGYEAAYLLAVKTRYHHIGKALPESIKVPPLMHGWPWPNLPPPPSIPRKPRKKSPNGVEFRETNRRSTSGFVGVHARITPDGTYWHASWSKLNGQRVVRSYSWTRYGYDIAYIKAVTARCRATGIPLPALIEAPPIDATIAVLDQRRENHLKKRLKPNKPL